jgi:hypothetical protein
MAKRKTDLSELYDNFAKKTGVDTKKATLEKKPQKRLSAGRNEAVPLGLITLDPYQPRQLIPVYDGIRDKYYSGANDWRKTTRLWLGLTASNPAIDRQVKELLEMGQSIKKLKQIEPATGAWVETQAGEDRFTLSTGERRFWSLALTAEVEKQEEEPQLICQVIKLSEMNLERQFVENESSKPLSAIGRARVIAGLILDRVDELPPELDRNSPTPPTDYEYYKSALDLETLMGRKNMPKGIWEEIGEIMGMERKYMANHLKLLKLPGDLQYQVDINDIPETVLREVLVYSPAQWEKIIPKIIKENLTAAEVKKIQTVKRKKTSTNDTPAAKAASRLRAYWKVTREMNSSKDLEQVATDFAAGLEKKEILKGAESLEKLAKKLRLRAQD